MILYIFLILGGPLLAYNTEDITNPRVVQLGVVHGGVKACESDVYPSIYNRIDSPVILTWIREYIFKGKFLLWLYNIFLGSFDTPPPHSGNLFTRAY